MSSVIVLLANVQMLEDGMAYPMFYEYLPDRLLRLLQGAVTTAKTEKKGFWPEDQTLLGARFLNTDDVEGAVFYPKLARRLFRYFDTLPSGARGMGLRGFREFLKNGGLPASCRQNRGRWFPR